MPRSARPRYSSAALRAPDGAQAGAQAAVAASYAAAASGKRSSECR